MDHRRTCGPLLTETLLFSTYLYMSTVMNKILEIIPHLRLENNNITKAQAASIFKWYRNKCSLSNAVGFLALDNEQYPKF